MSQSINDSTEAVADTRSWSQRILDLYGEGASDAEVAASIRVTVKAFYKQMQDNKTFADLVDFGRTLSQAWWEGQFRRNVRNRQYNATLLTFYMKNKHGWADKVESSNTNDNTNTDLDSLRQQAAKMAQDFVKKHTPELTDAQRVLEGIGSDLEH